MKIGLMGLAATLFASTASAAKLGDSGTTAIGGQLGVGMQSIDVPPAEPARVMGVHGVVAGDRFIADRVSLGLMASGSSLTATFSDGGVQRKSRFNSAYGAVSVGYFIPIGDRAGLWPVARVGAGASFSRHGDGSAGGFTSRDAYGVVMAADLQLTYAISDHLYLRAVPGGVRAEIMKFDQGSARTVSAGFNGVCFFGLGGWF